MNLWFIICLSSCWILSSHLVFLLVICELRYGVFWFVLIELIKRNLSKYKGRKGTYWFMFYHFIYHIGYKFITKSIGRKDSLLFIDISTCYILTNVVVICVTWFIKLWTLFQTLYITRIMPKWTYFNHLIYPSH